MKAASTFHSLCLDKVMKAPMAFFDANPEGRLLNRFSKDLDEGTSQCYVDGLKGVQEHIQIMLYLGVTLP